MTEDEAKTKACCKEHNAGPCIGSSCMAWRWQTDQHGPDPENPGGDLIRRPDLYGFCGLAGAPQ